MKSRAEAWDDMMDRKYSRFGVVTAIDSRYLPAGTTLSLIDMTKGVETGDGFAQVATVTPVAAVRKSELSALEITPGDIVDVCFSMNSATWRIKSFAEKPGIGQSEIYLMLEAV